MTVSRQDKNGCSFSAVVSKQARNKLVTIRTQLAESSFQIWGLPFRYFLLWNSHRKNSNKSHEIGFCFGGWFFACFISYIFEPKLIYGAKETQNGQEIANESLMSGDAWRCHSTYLYRWPKAAIFVSLYELGPKCSGFFCGPNFEASFWRDQTTISKARRGFKS